MINFGFRQRDVDHVTYFLGGYFAVSSAVLGYLIIVGKVWFTTLALSNEGQKLSGRMNSDAVCYALIVLVWLVNLTCFLGCIAWPAYIAKFYLVSDGLSLLVVFLTMLSILYCVVAVNRILRRLKVKDQASREGAVITRAFMRIWSSVYVMILLGIPYLALLIANKLDSVRAYFINKHYIYFGCVNLVSLLAAIATNALVRPKHSVYRRGSSRDHDLDQMSDTFSPNPESLVTKLTSEQHGEVTLGSYPQQQQLPGSFDDEYSLHHRDVLPMCAIS